MQLVCGWQDYIGRCKIILLNVAAIFCCISLVYSCQHTFTSCSQLRMLNNSPGLPNTTMHTYNFVLTTLGYYCAEGLHFREFHNFKGWYICELPAPPPLKQDNWLCNPRANQLTHLWSVKPWLCTTVYGVALWYNSWLYISFCQYFCLL